MAQYIDKSALVSEIERIKKEECPTDSYEGRCKLLWFEQFLSFLNTLEVKEVDNIWHNANETPKGSGDKEILVQFSDSHASVLEIDDWEYLDHQTKWAYLKDLI